MATYPDARPVPILSDGDGGESSERVAAHAAPATGAVAVPPPFGYITRSEPPAHTIEHEGGCHCTGPCQDSSCPCYSANREALTALASHDPAAAAVVTLLECGPACACSQRQPGGCAARGTQGGVTARLAVRPYPGKGWGLATLEPLPKGTFVCEYAGEYINTATARARLTEYDSGGRKGVDGADSGSGGSHHALLVARLVLPSGGAALRVNLDATRRGNVARFINHACDGGNLELVFVTPRGEGLPRVALFTSRDVDAGEELLFSYGGASPSAGTATARRCACGTAACTGFMPKEDV